MKESGKYSNSNLPQKRIGATALFLNHHKELLIVNPTYRDGWLTPGGTVETNESPYEGCTREVSEELGQVIPLHQLLCVEYRSAHDRKVENIQFVFWGGILSEEQIDNICLPQGEISEYRFCDHETAFNLLNYNLANRVKVALSALDQGHIVYLENRQEIK